MKPEIKPIGVGDLKVVKQLLVRYAPGEVAHIETIMATESRKREHRRLRRDEETVTLEQEREEESKRDLQTTERFELQQETQKTIQSDTKFQIGAEISVGYGPFFQLGISSQFSTSNSKTESDRNSTNYAKEITDRSLSRLVERSFEQRISKTLEEVEEKNEHGFDNTSGENRSGIYRWVDKYYRAKVVDYGKRLFYEFIVPEPAAFFIFASTNNINHNVLPEKPEPPRDLDSDALLSPDLITRTNYLALARAYGAAGIEPPPAKQVILSRLIGRELQQDQHWAFADNELNIPAGYVYKTSSTNFSFGGGLDEFQFTVHRGRQTTNRNIDGSESNGVSNVGIGGPFPIGARGAGIRSLMLSATVVCSLTPEAEDAWRLKTYNTIMGAFNKQLLDYEEKLAAAQVQQGVEIAGNNPLLNRGTEREELRKGCITLWTGFKYNGVPGIVQSANAAVPNNYPEIHIDNALEMTKEIQFLEQAFDWKNMTYQFYPYYWARKKKWLDLFPLEDDDPLFNEFLRAGAARVLVPVNLAFTEAVLFYQLTGKMWSGDAIPDLEPHDPASTIASNEVNETDEELALYRDYLAELQGESAVNDIDADVEISPDDPDAWMIKVPTTLVWLQQDQTLPDFEAEDA